MLSRKLFERVFVLIVVQEIDEALRQTGLNEQVSNRLVWLRNPTIARHLLIESEKVF